VSSRLVGSGTRGATLEASKLAASRPALGLAALTPRLFSVFILCSAAAAAWDRRASALGGRERERDACDGLPAATAP